MSVLMLLVPVLTLISIAGFKASSWGSEELRRYHAGQQLRKAPLYMHLFGWRSFIRKIIAEDERYGTGRSK